MYTNISDNELVQYHKKIKANKHFKLDDILDDNILFIVSQHGTSTYKIVPLFYCESISSSNTKDKVLDNRCIICTYDSDTVISFRTYKEFEDFDVIVNTVEKWEKTIFYGAAYEKAQLTPIKEAEVTIELLEEDAVTSTTMLLTNENGEFVHFINSEYDHIRVTVTYENITHSKTI